METFAKLLTWLGKPVLVLSAAWASCGLALWVTKYPAFAPAKKVIDPYQGWIQVGLIGSSAMLAVFFVAKVGTWTSGAFHRRQFKKARFKRLQSLTIPERHILQVYLETGSRTANWPIDDGVVSALIGCGILYRPDGVADFRRFPTHIAEDIWLYINANPGLISTPGNPRRLSGPDDWMRY